MTLHMLCRIVRRYLKQRQTFLSNFTFVCINSSFALYTDPVDLPSALKNIKFLFLYFILLVYYPYVQVESEAGNEERKTPEDLQRCRGLLEEVIAQKVNVEELSDRCELLMELSACSWVRDETVQLQSAYTALLTAVQG